MKKYIFLLASVIFTLKGLSQPTGSYYAGTNAGNGTVSGTNSTSVGVSAGDLITGTGGSYFGSYAGRLVATGTYNSFFGMYAGYNTSGGSQNVFIGATAGNNNVAGNGNVFLGYAAGYSETGSNKLYIDNSSTTTPLLYGDFNLNQIGINLLPTSGYTLSVGGALFSTGSLVSASGVLNVPSATPLSFQVNGSTKMTLLTSGNIGIGTTTPGNRLDVTGNTFNRISAGVTADVQTGFQAIKTGANATNWEMYVPAGSTDFRFNNAGLGDVLYLKSDGKVGVGITPSEKLHVSGNILTTGNLTASGNVAGVNLTASGTVTTASLSSSGTIATTSGVINVNSTTNALQLQTNGTTKMTITNSGEVGIGTTTPGTFKLAVNGAIAAKDLQIINTTGPTWPDYVFSKEYQLPSLQSVEKYIKENNHLEGVPSAQEVKENGYSASTLDQALLKKVEELTLYVIEQQKQIEALQQEVAKKKRSRK